MVKRIILHWSAGRYFPTIFEKNYYHYLIDVEGKIYNGKFTPEDNNSCTDGKYAAHTGGGNTGSIGVCMCGMYGYKSPEKCGDFPISAIQFEACMKFTAELCKNIICLYLQTRYLLIMNLDRQILNQPVRGK